MPTWPVVLAIDPGASTGWAVQTPGGGFDFGTWRLSLRHGPGRRFNELVVRLDGLRRVYPITYVAFEEPFVGEKKNANACGPLYGFKSHIQSWADRASLPCVSYQPSAIKRHAGDGRADKEKMIRLAKLFGYDAKTNHEADAIHLLRLALAVLDRRDLFDSIERTVHG